MKDVPVTVSSWCSPQISYHHTKLFADDTSLFILMAQKEWECVRSLLLCEEEHETLFSGSIEQDKFCSKGNILHALCRHQPPLDIVKDVAQRWPKFVKQQDDFGQLPLHTAALFGAKSDIVKYLLDLFPVAALKSDVSGRLPLHHACCPIRWVPRASRSTNLRKNRNSIRPGVAVIRILCNHAPHTTFVEDCIGLSPIELALDHDLHQSIITAMLDASNKAWNEQLEKISHFSSRKYSLPGYRHSAKMNLMTSYAESSESIISSESRTYNNRLDRRRTVGEIVIPTTNQLRDLFVEGGHPIRGQTIPAVVQVRSELAPTGLPSKAQLRKIELKLPDNGKQEVTATADEEIIKYQDNTINHSNETTKSRRKTENMFQSPVLMKAKQDNTTPSKWRCCDIDRSSSSSGSIISVKRRGVSATAA